MQKHMNYSLDILFYMSSLMFKKSMKASRAILIAMLFTVLNANTIEFEKGWNFVGFDNEISFASDSSFSDAKKVKILWKYNNITKEWSIYSPNTQINDLIEKAGYTKATLLENSNGAWILANENFSYEPSSKNHTQTNNDIQVSQGWNLLSGVDNATLSLTDNLFVNSAMVWVYRKGTWYLKHNLVDVNSTVIKNLETINPNEAFWLYKTADTNSTNEIEKYYGKWIYMLTGDELYIDSNYTMNDFTVIDNDLIQITKDGNTSNLMRSSVPDIQVKGTIETLSGTGLGRMLYLSLVDIAITLKNVNDSNIKAETTVDENGSFIMPQKLPSGTYDLTVKDNKNVLQTIQKDVEIKNAVEDLGVFKLTGTAINNFKAQLIVDAENVYADGNTYTGKIRVFNISDKDGLGLYYEINSTDSSIKEFAHDNVKGSVLAKGYKDVPISFSFNTIDTNSKKVTVDVKINDANSNTWIDTFDFTIYKTELSVNIATELASIKGYMILPHTNEIKRIDLVNGSIKMPSSDQEYHMVLVNTSILDETTYSIGINTPADTNFDSLWQTNIHEPNNLGKDAKILKVNEKVMSYLHLHDVDYWKISSVSKMPPQNEAPIATFTSFTMDEDTIYHGVLTSSDAENNVTTYTKVLDSSHGTLNIDSNGTFSYAPSSNYNGSDSFSYKVNDGSLDSETQVVSINITSVNDAPTMNTSFSNISLMQNSGTKNYELNISDIDGDGLTLLVESNDTSIITVTRNWTIPILQADYNSQTLDFNLTTDTNITGMVKITLTLADKDINFTTSFDVNVTQIGTGFQSGDVWKGLTYRTVTSPYTGRIWLDRNLGASQVCTALDDEACYGDYYQWGRKADGHEKTTSSTTSTQSSSTYPSHGDFIIGSSDWTSSDSNGSTRASSWNVCPSGFRLPTISELEAENITNQADAYSKLKLPSAGYRYNSGSVSGQGSYGFVWSSSVSGSNSLYLRFVSDVEGSYGSMRANGLSVRCIQDNTTQNSAPIANAGIDQNVSEGASVTLDATLSSDSDGTIASYEWKDGDTVLSTLSSFTKLDFSVGIHTITLTITDNDGATTTDTVVLTVTTVVISTSALKKTGQTTSYTDYDDGYYQLGLNQSYTRDNTKEIVTDNVTKLIWQDNATPDSMVWTDAQTYCSELTLWGYNDWRLPTIKELQTIVNDGKHDPSIDTTFQNIISNYYWSSTNLLFNYTSTAWMVNFSNGSTNGYYKTNNSYVRCVRGGR